MRRFLSAFLFTVGFLMTGPAAAAEQTLRFAVENMT